MLIDNVRVCSKTTVRMCITTFHRRRKGRRGRRRSTCMSLMINSGLRGRLGIGCGFASHSHGMGGACVLNSVPNTTTCAYHQFQRFTVTFSCFCTHHEPSGLIYKISSKFRQSSLRKSLFYSLKPLSNRNVCVPAKSTHSRDGKS